MAVQQGCFHHIAPHRRKDYAELWDRAPFSLRVVRQMRKTGGQSPRFGGDFRWALLASKEGLTRAAR